MISGHKPIEKNSKSNLVEIQQVYKSFPPAQEFALENISTKIPKGQMVGLAGPDGAGKTTLIRLMAGLLKPTSGHITLMNLDTIKNSEAISQYISYMPQKFGLYEDLTVIQNLNLYADLKGAVGKEKEQKIKELLQFTSLEPFQERLAGALSGGMKQKLGLACALITKPTLLLLDEPSVGVDPISRRELWKMVEELIDQGISVVWSTSYLDEAEKCDLVLLLNEGKIIYQGNPKKLTDEVKERVFYLKDIKDNRRKLLREVLEQTNVIDGVIQGKEIRVVTSEPTKNLKSIVKIDDPSIQIEPATPRFEDAFIVALGGGPGGKSLLAEAFPINQKASQEVIQAEHLTKKFGNFVAANNITFKVRKGEIFGLLGPNGAGKSTTFKMLCGLLPPTSGFAKVNGLDLQIAPSEARSKIGYMAQKFSLYGNLTVWQNLNFFSGIYNLKGKTKFHTMQEMIDIFDFKHYINDQADSLPLGFKQRLALACAVMHHPDVLFLDEPTSGVDPITRREFWNHINGLVEKGVTVLVTTHFMDEAEYCDRIALVYKGQTIIIGSPDELKQKAITSQNPSPSLEDAFIQLIKEYNEDNFGR
ncbi:putative ABC transporter ATP-binding protein YbhF [Candidatus Rubidus massiliensis]|nr:putative ABC transporter ATP-binding protein YbhF [Candidatus Rubidus massiliensis]